MRQVNCSDRIFSGPIFAVDRDRLIESNGLEVSRDVIRHPGGAGALPIFADGRVALVRQYRHPARAELLEIPAGRLEAGETPELCASREVEQETGFRPGRVERLSSFYTTPGFCEEVLHIFLATDLTPTRQQLDHDELVEVQFFPLAEVLQMVHRGEIVDSKTIIALLLASANGTPSGAS